MPTTDKAGKLAQHYTEELYLCPKCKQPIGVLARLYGRPIGLRLPMIQLAGQPVRYHLARGLNSVCEGCKTPIHFAVGDTTLTQLVVELQAAGVL
jgi:hypothetical protein